MVVSFEQAYPAIYGGWDEAGARADFEKYGQQKWAEYMARTNPSPQQSTQRLFDKQKAEEEGFLTRFREAYPSIVGRLEGELGLPALREAAFGLSETLRNIPQVQTAATRGFDVNANQLERKIAQEQKEVAPLAQRAVGQAQFAQEQFTNRLGQELQPFEFEAGMISDRLAREVTGYGQAAQNELSLILAKMSQGAAVTAAEAQRAHELAMQEQEFENQKALYTFTHSGSGSGSNINSYLPSSSQRPPLQTLWEATNA